MLMKKSTSLIIFIMLTSPLLSQSLKPIVLNPPDTRGGMTVMKALSLRSSAEAWDSTDLRRQDLSDLLWAANGINRKETGKRTAPSAMNSQDVDVYVFMKSGAFLYLAQKNVLEPVAAGDYRKSVAGRQEEAAVVPVICLMVSDLSRFKAGTDSLKTVWAAIDAGTVSQNIGIFCASKGFATRPRTTMDIQKIREVLHLRNSQFPVLNNPVSYKNE